MGGRGSSGSRSQNSIASKIVLDGKSHHIQISGASLTYYSLDTTSKNTLLYIEDIEVAKEMRGKGIGTSLLNGVKSFADENNIRVALQPVPIHESTMTTTELTDWYKKRGFEPLNKKQATLIYTPKRRAK